MNPAFFIPQGEAMRTILLTVLFIALLSSITFNFILYQKNKYYSKFIKEIRLDPLALNTYSIMNNLLINDPKSQLVIFFGDSRAYEWPTPLDMPSFTFLNRGICGETSVQSAARFASHVNPLQPQIVVIQIGINDLTAIDFLPDRKEAIIADCKRHIETIVYQARQIQAIVILCTIFPLGPERWLNKISTSSGIMDAVDEVNDFIYSLAKENVLIFDTSKILAAENGRVYKTYSRDRLHLNQAGYQALNQKLIKILVQLKE